LVRGAFIGGTRSIYAGRMREIRTLRGRRLSVTPNHPIGTVQGLRAAALLDVGDELLCDGRIADAHQGRSEELDQDEAPSRIEDVFDALAVRGISRRVKPRAHDFHGDARWLMGEIDAITPDHHLRREPVTGGCYRGGETMDMLPGHGEPSIAQLALDAARVHASPFDLLGSRTRPDTQSVLLEMAGDHAPRNAERDGELFHGIATTIPLDEIGGVEDVKSLLDAPSSAESSSLDAVLAEVMGERGITDPAILREAVLRFAGAVTLDEIVEIRDYEFRGHVYDLMTESGLMIADGIIASNCTLLYYDEAP
jgi:hypothetical protein